MCLFVVVLCVCKGIQLHTQTVTVTKAKTHIHSVQTDRQPDEEGVMVGGC
ncbi:hypothetical protein SAMD00019534_075880 [Acytostelium subglobosum LB1]|nr:hypothetical protein SAMD00019534_075880 [Acytostelium subglobosum LB1]GAM24413.1 hypothetical protein SAMD00019534_075880 [Acytostelium subglobosum LB1]|eukprot:XP_012752739.1 hypothetical protein SAMD00019534_075880 [Acytostelium subglobosum LB1]